MKYHKDFTPEEREHYNAWKREKYATNTEYRENCKKYQKVRYLTNEEYRKITNKRSHDRYWGLKNEIS